MHCTYYSCTAHCVCYTQHSSKAHWKIYRTTTTNWLFSSLSLSWLVPILFSATSEAWGNQHITEKAQPLVTSIIPLCCVVPDTVNDNQWTNNNLAGLIMLSMLTQQLVIHWSICQYCTVEQRVVLSSWKRNNSVYYNINIKSGFIQNPKLIQREENFTIFQLAQKAWCCILKEQNFFRLKFVSNWHISTFFSN